MKSLLSVLILFTLGACATIPQTKPKATTVDNQTVAPSFSVDQYFEFQAGYSAPNKIAIVVPHGPTGKEAFCTFAGMIPDGAVGNLQLAVQCIRVKFIGPTRGGKVVMWPVTAGSPPVIAYGAWGVTYDARGVYSGAVNHVIGPFPTADKCRVAAADLLQDAYKTGKVSATDSLLIYCIPFTKLTANSSSTIDFRVAPYSKPCPWSPWVGEGACQIEIREELL